jgi:hypothetical protein
MDQFYNIHALNRRFSRKRSLRKSRRQNGGVQSRKQKKQRKQRNTRKTCGTSRRRRRRKQRGGR